MEMNYNPDCQHARCQGYLACQFAEDERRRDDFWHRLRAEESMRNLGTDPLTALNGNLADWLRTSPHPLAVRSGQTGNKSRVIFRGPGSHGRSHVDSVARGAA
jgi:hypothetical protein